MSNMMNRIVEILNESGSTNKHPADTSKSVEEHVGLDEVRGKMKTPEQMKKEKDEKAKAWWSSMDKKNAKKEELELDEAKMNSLAKKGDYEFFSRGDGIVKVTYKSRVISSGDFDRGADGWFLDVDGKQKFFDTAMDVVNFFSSKRITEALDPVDDKENDKKFKDRKDKDIDNDGDTDSSDEYLHKRRKAISKSLAKESVELEEKNTVQVIGGTSKKGGEFFMGDKGVDKMIALSKENPNIEYTVKSDNYGDFKAHWLKNGKFARKTVANSNFDFSKNAVRGKPRGKLVKDTIFSVSNVVKESVDESLSAMIMKKHNKTKKDQADAKKNIALKQRLKKSGIEVKENLDEATVKVKTTMADKVIANAKRFGVKATKTGADVVLSGGKGKINDYLDAIIGRESMGNVSTIDESVTEARKDSAQDTYFDSYSGAISHALAQAKKQGYEVDDEDVFSEITTGQGKPGKGKTVRHTLKLTKGGKAQKKALHIQVYNRGVSGNTFELNSYIS